MVVKREELDHVRLGHPHRLHTRRGQPKCHYCDNPASFLCDHPQPLPEGTTPEDLAGLDAQTAAKLTTCSRPCCARHACWWKGKLQLCKEHAEQEGVWA